MLEFIREELAAGRQAYFVYPLLDPSEELEGVKSAREMVETLARTCCAGFRVELLYGPLPDTEKEAIMADFRARRIHVLVATVVVEVGIDVANASTMVIENAERFGLAQLHQLRGRIGRGAHASHCFLLSAGGGEEARERLGTLVATQNGFRIAEKDLELRGPGDWFGIRQSGLPALRFLDPIRDFPLLRTCKLDVEQLLRTDPRLEGSDLAALRSRLGTSCQEWFEVAHVG